MGGVESHEVDPLLTNQTPPNGAEGKDAFAMPPIVRQDSEALAKIFTTWAERFRQRPLETCDTLSVEATLVSVGGDVLCLSLTSLAHPDYYTAVTINCPDRDDDTARVYQLDCKDVPDITAKLNGWASRLATHHLDLSRGQLLDNILDKCALVFSTYVQKALEAQSQASVPVPTEGEHGEAPEAEQEYYYNEDGAYWVDDGSVCYLHLLLL